MQTLRRDGDIEIAVVVEIGDRDWIIGGGRQGRNRECALAAAKQQRRLRARSEVADDEIHVCVGIEVRCLQLDRRSADDRLRRGRERSGTVAVEQLHDTADRRNALQGHREIDVAVLIEITGDNPLR